MLDYIAKLDAIMDEVAQITDPVARTMAWTRVMSWLQEELPIVRAERRDAARDAKTSTTYTYVQLADMLGMTESTVRRLVSEADR
jgi:hypothetical protein